MGTPSFHNWFGTLESSPHVIVEAKSVDDLVAIMRDPAQYPAPVRAAGSAHSTTRCGMADGGTIVNMRGMDRILHIGPETVTAEAGALYIDVAQALRRRNLQFYVNIELGNLTVGSAACCATKDASLPGEFGQVNSYVAAMKLVTPSGEALEITEAQPELLQAARSSYGLFGIVYEVTFRVRPLRPMVVYHRRYSLNGFERALPALWARDESMMLYIDPFARTVTVEFRYYRGDTPPVNPTSWQWTLRNFVWKTLAPYLGSLVWRYAPSLLARSFIINQFNQLSSFLLVALIQGRNTAATDQMIRYPAQSDASRYTFSIWAFPEERYISVLRAYCDFCDEHFRATGYRTDLMNVGYRILKDTSSLFSYSYEGNVMTVDPVSTGQPGWDEFLHAYNDFCSSYGGAPLLNQSHLLTRTQVERAFGERLGSFRRYRERFDPDGRPLNAYFKELLA